MAICVRCPRLSAQKAEVAWMPLILILDEQTVYRAGLRSLVSAEIPYAEVIEASNLPQALDHIRNSTIDLVLVGTGRSSLATFDSLKTARETSPATRFAVSYPHPTLGQTFSRPWQPDFTALLQNASLTPRFSPPLRVSWLG